MRFVATAYRTAGYYRSRINGDFCRRFIFVYDDVRPNHIRKFIRPTFGSRAVYYVWNSKRPLATNGETRFFRSRRTSAFRRIPYKSVVDPSAYPRLRTPYERHLCGAQMYSRNLELWLFLGKNENLSFF